MKRPTIRNELEAILSPEYMSNTLARYAVDDILKSRKFVVRRRAVGRKG